jgi:hypothetical protein
MTMENDESHNFIPFSAVSYARNAASFFQARGPSRLDRSTAWNENSIFKNGGGRGFILIFPTVCLIFLNCAIMIFMKSPFKHVACGDQSFLATWENCGK